MWLGAWWTFMASFACASSDVQEKPGVTGLAVNDFSHRAQWNVGRKAQHGKQYTTSRTVVGMAATQTGFDDSRMQVFHGSHVVSESLPKM